MRQQAGYFLIIAVLLIMVMSVVGIYTTHVIANKSKTTVNAFNGAKAFYVAESGLEAAARALVGSGVALRLTCSTLSGNAALTNASVLGGTFTATAINNALYSASSTTTSVMNVNSNTVDLASSAGFAAHGRVRIDSEAIDYAAVSGNTLVGLKRGVASTTIASHSSGASVTQSICLLNVVAGVPSVASPVAKRQLQMAVEILSSGSAWAVGARAGSSFSFIRWNTPTPSAWNDYSFSDSSNRENLQGVDIATDQNGFAVGVEKSNNFTILRWNSSAWSVTPVSGACSGQNLMSVSALSSVEAWAVGARYRAACAKNGPFRYTLLKWNGSSWSVLTPSSSPSIPADANGNQSLNAVSMRDTNSDNVAEVGFAVGDSGTILRFNGTNWVSSSSPSSNNLYGVNTVSASEAWAVGAGGVILRWNGSTWASVSSPTTAQLNSISMVDTSGNGAANVGWAVGAGGVIIAYNGSTWSVARSGGSDLNGVRANSASEAWAVGNAGTIWQWNGTSWASSASPLSVNLSSVTFGTGAAVNTGSLVGSWQEVFG